MRKNFLDLPKAKLHHRDKHAQQHLLTGSEEQLRCVHTKDFRQLASELVLLF